MDSMFAAFLKQIRRIPHGRVATYGDVAYAAGHPGAARQVAWALHSSGPGLPWHRVVGSQGKILTGGELAFEQRIRLQQEGVAFIGLRVAMDLHRFSFFAQRDGSKTIASKTKTPASKRNRSQSNKKAGKTSARQL